MGPQLVPPPSCYHSAGCLPSWGAGGTSSRWRWGGGRLVRDPILTYMLHPSHACSNHHMCSNNHMCVPTVALILHPSRVCSNLRMHVPTVTRVLRSHSHRLAMEHAPCSIPPGLREGTDKTYALERGSRGCQRSRCLCPHPSANAPGSSSSLDPPGSSCYLSDNNISSL